VITFRAATSTIPVIAFMLDPLEAGLVTNLARPGGNLTGITLDAGIEIWGKRLEILKEAIPSTAKAAFLGMRDGWEGSSGQFLRDAGGRLGISLISMLPQEGTPSEIERVFAAMGQQRPDAVLVSGEGDLYAHRRLIVELAEKNRLPAMCPYRDYVDAGGLRSAPRQPKNWVRVPLDVINLSLTTPLQSAQTRWHRRSSRQAASVGGLLHDSFDNGPRGAWSSPPVR
jgi:putative ABC transport system substrate-binding protein